ncbi:MAG: hypothetical protein ACLQU2_21175 [Candidatus Binataceae bacterium]
MTLPLLTVVVVVALTTVPSGSVLVVVLVVELVELVVTGVGSTTFSVVVVEEHPATNPHTAATIRTSSIPLNKRLIIKGCRARPRSVKHQVCAIED